MLLGNRLRLAATSDLDAQEWSGSREIVAEVPLTGLSFLLGVRKDPHPHCFNQWAPTSTTSDDEWGSGIGRPSSARPSR